MINDGSPDNSDKIMEKYAKLDERFRPFYQENKGVSAARNLGLKEARGEYVTFYDADDLIPENALERLYRAVKTENADIAIGRMSEFTMCSEYVYNDTTRLSNMKIIEKYDFSLLWSLSLANKIISLKLIRENDFWFENIAYSEDAIFNMQCVFASAKIAGCPVVTYHYRRRPCWHAKSVTQTTDLKLLNEFCYAHEKSYSCQKRVLIEILLHVRLIQYNIRNYRFCL